MAQKKRTQKENEHDRPTAPPSDDVPAEDSAERTEPEPETASGPVDLLSQKDAEIADLRDRLLYLQADLDNFKKRTEKRLRDSLEFAAEPVLKDLLPVLDNLERALAHAGETGPDGFSSLVEGLEHVVRQFHEALVRHGVEPVPGEGEPFDPEMREAMLQVPGDADGRVASVFEPGYRLKGRLLRPAKVSVTKLAPKVNDG